MSANASRARSSPLHNPDFRRLWAAQTISVYGTQITLLAVPLVAALTLSVSPVRVRTPRDARVPALRPAEPAGRRVGRPAPAAADHDRGRPRSGRHAPLDTSRRHRRSADHLAALRSRLHERLPRGVLRRRLPELPADAPRARPARGGQLETRVDQDHIATTWSRHRRRSHQRRHCPVRHRRRRDQLCPLGGPPVTDPEDRARGRAA